LFTYFISDLHLSGERPDIIKLFHQFLRDQASQAEALYILGDLFELWIGDDFVPTDIEPVIADLAALTTGGVPVFVMVGNRDFLMGKEFEKISGCTLISDPVKIDLYGTPTLLMHGDTLCIDDLDYQQFRSQVRDPAWQSGFLAKSFEERLAISKHARQESTRRTKEKPEDIMDVNSQAVEETFRQYEVLQIIHGHTHRPAIHELVADNEPVKRIVLGDWYNQASVLKVDADGYQLTPATSTN
jgi:UDP-2,3-diacylglucosamine hydrolase